MDYAAAADALIRRKLLEDIYDRMTDDEKKLFVLAAVGRNGDSEILKALERQETEIGSIGRMVSRHTWLRDFSSNVAGNAAWDAAVWLGGKLLGKL